MRHQPFVTSISALPSFALGDPVLVDFEIENTSSDAYQVLTWGTPFEGRLTDDCLDIERDGVTIPYDGKLVKRGDPPAAAYALIKPGDRLKARIDISEAYAIDEAGHYVLALRANFLDAFVVPGAAKAGPRKRPDYEAHGLPSTGVAFEVVAGAQPKLTSGQLAREASAKRNQQAKQSKSDAKAPDFNGGSATDHADAIVAHNNAQHFAALAASQLDAGPAASNALYHDWFGSFDQGRYDEVTKDYKDISNTLVSEQVTYDFTGDGHGSDTCNPGDFAFTYKGDRTVWLCSSYISAPQIGTDCKFGTLVHEWSHAVAKTDDNVYGESGCTALAVSDAVKAVNNADSHEYFTEHLAQSDFGKALALIADRSTFGKDEIDAMLLQASPAVIGQAFYVVADGFWPDKLGISASTLGNAPSVKPSISVSPPVPGLSISVTSLAAEEPSLPASPQRFTWVCQIAFANSGGFPGSAGATQTVNLTAALGGLSASAQILLIREPNPYEIDGPTSWLSTDVRVFQIRAGDSRFGVSMGSDASAFIKQVIANLNAGSSGGDTFDGISTDQQASQLELSQKVGGTSVYNFALAKVRYRGTTDISNVRVFFRLFPASTTSTAFDGATTYRRVSAGGKTIPLLGLSAGGDLLTIPCFAENRVDSASADLGTQADPANVRTIVHGAGETSAYFGCWLDINQTTPQIPTHPSPANGPWSSGRKSVQELIRNAHQCLVAEIAFDPDPIPGGISPAASDKLAQRNLAVVESANPGLASSRTILSTFELHPARGTRLADAGPDELLIDWGNTPRDAVATIYIPEIGAGQIVELTASRNVGSRITQVDPQTIQLPVGGISYVLLPAGAAFGITGLLSIELPPTVVKGQVYKVVVRQITDAFGRRPAPVDAHGLIRAVAQATAGTGATELIRWRRVIGSYQVTIPVRTKEVMLPRESRLLSVLRWILQSVPSNDRWYPVFSRYVGLMGDRVGALGGNPDQVSASPDGSGGEHGGQTDGQTGPGTGHPRPDREQRHEGKVSGLIYDCFGDFEGFLLDTCCREIAFHCREHRLEALARQAWRERIAIVVVAGCSDPHHPVSIILRHAPEPFQG